MTTSVSQLLSQVADYYDDKVRQHGATPRGADWRDAESQELRFAQLAKVMKDETSGSVAEVGCGWGAFPLWAQRRGLDIDYTGYDIAEGMLQEAKQTCLGLKKARFVKGDKISQSADYIVASGIFNVRFEANDSEWLNFAYSTIDNMYSQARRGIAVNFLTSFSDTDRMEDRLFYASPGLVLDHCVRKYGRHVALYHDYGLYEFTVVVWR